jgi:hypothetical protein
MRQHFYLLVLQILECWFFSFMFLIFIILCRLIQARKTRKWSNFLMILVFAHSFILLLCFHRAVLYCVHVTCVCLLNYDYFFPEVAVGRDGGGSCWVNFRKNWIGIDRVGLGWIWIELGQTVLQN